MDHIKFCRAGDWIRLHFHWLLLLCLLTSPLNVSLLPADTKRGASEFRFGQSPECGIADKVITDVRASVPWTAAIFLRTPGSKSGLQFHVTGTVISETTVLTVAGGVFGAFPRGAKSKYFITPPENYMVGVGLNSTNPDKRDQFSQFSEVSYILPYNDHVRSNRHYHYILFHLKTPLNFSTPYVKPLCLPVILQNTNYGSFKWKYVQGGFAKPAQSDGSFPLKQFVISSGSKEECNSLFRYYYKGSGDGDAQHTFCGRRKERDPGDDEFCHLHGSVCMFQVQDRYYLTGITSLIPDQKRGTCNRSTTYIYSEELLYAKGKPTLDWLVRNTKCKPNEYSCRNGTKIPLSSVCNLTPDCEGGSDEDPTYCEAVNQCTTADKVHSCGLKGKCIAKNQICDQKRDCPDASDEAPTACSKVSGGDIQLLQRSQRTCPPLNLTSGVVANCKSLITREVVSCKGELEPGTVATLTCDKFTTPLYSISRLELECDERSKWKPALPFSCETVCGEVKSLGKSDGGVQRLPWNVAIYRQISGTYQLHCSATLIEPSFLLTSANCLAEAVNIDSAQLQEEYKVVISPVSNDFLANSKDSVAQILTVTKMWIPESYNKLTKSSEVALLKLEKPVKLGGFVRPICYLVPVSSVMPEAGREGKVSVFSNSETPQPVKHHNFPVASHETCSKTVGSDFSSIFTFCAGFTNGTSLCGKNNGAGIYFRQNPGKAPPKFILEGVVTQGLPGPAQECKRNSYTIFTSVQAFEDWLVGILEKNS